MQNPTNNSNRPIPQNPNAEQSVLGSILIAADPLEAFEIASGIIIGEDFYVLQNRLIYEAMAQLVDQNMPIDVNLIAEQLRKTNNFDNAGKFNYISNLAMLEPTSANLEYYARSVHDLALQRRTIQELTNAAAGAYEIDGEIGDYLADVNNRISALEDDRENLDFITIDEALRQTQDNIQALSENGGKVVTGIPTGFTRLDTLTTGLQPNALIVLAARPSVGKTAFALNIALNAAKTKGKDGKPLPVALFSMEMNANSLTSRLMAAESGVDLKKILTGAGLTKKDWEDVGIASLAISQTNMFVDDTPGININVIRAKLRNLQKQQGQLGLVVVDYLQLIESNNHEGRQQAVAEISRALKKLAMELEVPILALSQLSRGVESRNNKRPGLSDLRESGAIEQDADVVMFLYREDYYNNEQDNGDFWADPQEAPTEAEKDDIEILIEKNRQGERDTVTLKFNKPIQKFSNIAYMPEPNDGSMPTPPPMNSSLSPF